MLARDGDNSTDLLAAGELAIYAGQSEKALSFCRRAVAIEPSAATYGGLGEIHFALGQHDSSLIYLRRAVEADPQQARFRFNLANNLEVLGMFEEADIHFQAYIKMEPEDAIGHFNYGVHLDNLDRIEAALNEISAAVNLDPRMVRGHVVQAQLLERLGQFADAANVLERLLASEDQELESRDQVILWIEQLRQSQQKINAAFLAGKIHLLHLVTEDTAIVDIIQQELAQGVDFATLAIRCSSGTTAATGGDIGWVSPKDMVEPLRSAIESLAPNETSPPIETSGLFHFFRRVN